jgi:hypothetical protein
MEILIDVVNATGSTGRVGFLHDATSHVLHAFHHTRRDDT